MAEGKFTKADMISAVCDKTGMSRREIRMVLDVFVGELKAALARRCAIELRGFGTFEVRVRKARSAERNPKTGEAVPARPRASVAFRPGRDLRLDAWAAAEGASQAGAGCGAMGGALGGAQAGAGEGGPR